MAAGSSLLEELFILSLVAAVAVTAYLLLKSRKELGSYKLIFDDLPQPILRVDLGRFEPIACNRAFSHLLGYASNDECIAQFTHNPHLPQQNFYQIYRLCQASSRQRPHAGEREGIDIEIEIHNLRGEVVDHATAVRLDPADQYMDIVLDRYKRGFADESFSRELLYRQNLLPYLKLDIKLNITSCNLAAQELFQLDQLADTSTPFAKILPAKNSERLLRIYRKRLTRHGRLILKHEVRTGENSTKHGQWVIFRDPDTYHYHAFFKVESASQVLDSPLYDLLDNNIGVWEIDRPKGLIFHNEGWLRHLGYETTSNINQLPTWFSLISPVDRDRVQKTIEDATADGPFTIQYGLASKQGVELLIETRGFVVERDDEGKPILVRGIHMDLTNEKDRILGKKVHHELMGKLASVMGYSELIRSSTEVPARIKDFAAEVMTGGEQIRLLLQSSENTAYAGASLEQIAKKFNLSFTGNFAIPFNVSGDILDRAISGVMDFMNKEGNGNSRRYMTAMSQEIEQCSACDRGTDEAVFAITLTDTGLDFDREHLKYMLTPGFVTAGVGEMVNLVQVSDLIHQQGGHIRLTIGDSGFSTVLFFPITGLAKPVPIGMKESGNNILIIDDELAVANYLKEVIQQAGYTVTVFTDPGAALAQFKENPDRFDLVITDQTMPGVSGDVVMQTMLEQRPELPIIICTGYSEAVDARAALALGAVGYVTKPVKVSHLVDIVQHALHGAAS